MNQKQKPALNSSVTVSHQSTKIKNGSKKQQQPIQIIINNDDDDDDDDGGASTTINESNVDSERINGFAINNNNNNNKQEYKSKSQERLNSEINNTSIITSNSMGENFHRARRNSQQLLSSLSTHLPQISNTSLNRSSSNLLSTTPTNAAAANRRLSVANIDYENSTKRNRTGSICYTDTKLINGNLTNRRHSLAFNTHFIMPPNNKPRRLSKIENNGSPFKNDSESNLNRKMAGTSPFRKISVCKDASSDMKFGCILSTEAQYSVLKTYEDEIYNKLKYKYPLEPLPRVSTPEFNSKFENTQNKKCSVNSLNSDSSNNNFNLNEDDEEGAEEEDEENDQMNTRFRKMSLPNYEHNTNSKTNSINTLNNSDQIESLQYRINKQIDLAMEILDGLSAEFNKNTSSDNLINNGKGHRKSISIIDSNNNNSSEIINKYKSWHLRWLSMLNEI